MTVKPITQAEFDEIKSSADNYRKEAQETLDSFASTPFIQSIAGSAFDCFCDIDRMVVAIAAKNIIKNKDTNTNL